MRKQNYQKSKIKTRTTAIAAAATIVLAILVLYAMQPGWQERYARELRDSQKMTLEEFAGLLDSYDAVLFGEEHFAGRASHFYAAKLLELLAERRNISAIYLEGWSHLPGNYKHEALQKMNRGVDVDTILRSDAVGMPIYKFSQRRHVPMLGLEGESENSSDSTRFKEMTDYLVSTASPGETGLLVTYSGKAHTIGMLRESRGLATFKEALELQGRKPIVVFLEPWDAICDIIKNQQICNANLMLSVTRSPLRENDGNVYSLIIPDSKAFGLLEKPK